jgi:hypothetical protein
MKNFIEQNIKYLLIGLISIIFAVILIIFCSILLGTQKARIVRIIEISGNAFISRNREQMNANKNTSLLSGDVITTDKNSKLRILIDDDKIISVEPESSLYIQYTNYADKGDIIVSLTDGAVLNQINKPLSKKATYQVKTPNCVVDVKGTIFRVAFNYAESYLGYADVMTTDVQNFEGNVALTLYDYKGNASEKEMLLAEKKCAEMISCSQACRFNFLNQETNLYNMNAQTLKELIRAQSYRKLPYSSEELNNAFLKASKAAESSAVLNTEDTTEMLTGNSYFTNETSSGTLTEEPMQTQVPVVTEQSTVIYSVQDSEYPNDNENNDGGNLTGYTMPTGESWWIITGNDQ